VNGLTRSDRRIASLIEGARRLGATDARAISTADVFLDERVRFKCMVPRCGNYGRHLMCPPNLMSLEEFRRVLAAYRTAILVQLEAEVDSTDKAKGRLEGEAARRLKKTTGAHAMEKKLHSIITDLEALAFKNGFYFAAGLIGSECLLCDECAGLDGSGPCRHPFSARPSMQAMGIDVIKTTKKAGLPVRLSSEEKVRWTGLILLD